MRTPNLEQPHPNFPSEGVQRLYRFSNGYGASVVRFPYSYGYGEGLWELAVIVFEGEGLKYYTLTYDTQVTGDVLGYLTEEGVDEALSQIEALPSP